MRRLIGLTAAAIVILVLVVGQLVLPAIATDRLRDQLAQHGTVLHVEVHAFPAVQLLWHHADRVVIRMGRYRSSSSNLGSNLAQAGDVGTLDASAAVVDVGLLTVHDGVLHKRGDTLTGSATVTDAALRAAAPFLQSVQPVASGNGTLTLRGTATVLGVTVSADATVAARNGQLVVQPDVPFGSLATVTVFSNPHVAVESIGASGASDGLTLTATGSLR